MHDELPYLPRAGARLLMQAALEIPLAELKVLVNDSIQYGPPIYPDAPLTRIDQATTPPICWVALLEFTGWGAGVLSHASDYLLANTAHLERVLRVIARHLESDSGQNQQQVKLTNQRPRAQIELLRKYDDSHDLG